MLRAQADKLEKQETKTSTEEATRYSINVEKQGAGVSPTWYQEFKLKEQFGVLLCPRGGNRML